MADFLPGHPVKQIEFTLEKMNDYFWDEDFDDDSEEQLRKRALRSANQDRRKLRRRRRQRQMKIHLAAGAGVVVLAAGIISAAVSSGRDVLPFSLLSRAQTSEDGSVAADGEADAQSNAEIAVEASTAAAAEASTTDSAVAADTSSSEAETTDASSGGTLTETADGRPLVFTKTADTVTIPEMDDSQESDPGYVNSTYAILINADTGEIVAGRGYDDVISPASMTKILTLLVAVEHMKSEDSLKDTFTMTQEISDYTYQAGCSVAGFELGSTVTLEELLYGTILPSGADAACGLAYYTAGGIEPFAELMNEKAEELGISDTAHFDNPVGISSEGNKCTIKDIAVILQAAMSNELCAKVLSARTFQCTAANADNPDGILLSNWFLRRIEDKDTGGTVVGAKTGFVNESGSCAASYFTSDSGTDYICVTAKAYSSWRAIYDHVAIYKTYAK